MPTPGFSDPALASLPPAGDLYFGASSAISSPGEVSPGGAPGAAGTHSAAINLHTSSLMFPDGFTANGEPIANVAHAPGGKGHWSEVLNFHGSPAPWILIGILLVTGIMALEAKGKLGKARVGVSL